MFDFAIDTWHRAGDRPNLAIALASLAVSFDRLEQPDIAGHASTVPAAHSHSIVVVPPDFPTPWNISERRLDQTLSTIVSLTGAGMEPG